MVLLVGAGLLGKSFYRLLHVNIGVQPDHVATLEIQAPESSYAKDEQAIALERQVLGRVANLPGVKSVGISTQLPVSYNGNTTWIRFLDRPYHGEHNEANERAVSSDYFLTLQAKLLRGHYFSDAEDGSKPRVVIINQALARQYFPGVDPIGRKIGDMDLSPKSIAQIVGIVDDIREGSLDSEIWPAVYYPFNQSPNTYFSLVVRTSQTEQSLIPTLIVSIRQIDAGIVTSPGTTMREMIADSPSAYLHRSSAWLVGAFAARGIAARSGGTLWRGGLFGKPKNPGDRRAHGPGGTTRYGLPAHSEGGRPLDCHWHCRGPAVRLGSGNADAQTALRC